MHGVHKSHGSRGFAARNFLSLNLTSPGQRRCFTWWCEGGGREAATSSFHPSTLDGKEAFCSDLDHAVGLQ